MKKNYIKFSVTPIEDKKSEIRSMFPEQKQSGA
jgi:hypothetical protein